MRELTASEIGMVSGAGGDCSSGDGGNNLAGITSPEKIGEELVAIYEGLVAATSHMIERVANAL